MIVSGEQRENCRGWWAAVLADGRAGLGSDQSEHAALPAWADPS